MLVFLDGSDISKPRRQKLISSCDKLEFTFLRIPINVFFTTVSSNRCVFLETTSKCGLAYGEKMPAFMPKAILF